MLKVFDLALKQILKLLLVLNLNHLFTHGHILFEIDFDSILSNQNNHIFIVHLNTLDHEPVNIENIYLLGHIYFDCLFQVFVYQ